VRGTCADGSGGDGHCTCPASTGWTGATCNTCLANWTGANCDQCAPGYWNSTCQACTCQHGTCDQANGQCTGACNTGWTGANCDTCAPGFYGPNCTPCNCDHGTCEDGLAGKGCICDVGYGDTKCDKTKLGLYWKLDEASNSSPAADSSGNNNNGAYLGTGGTLPTPAPGVVPPSMGWDIGSFAFLNGSVTVDGGSVQREQSVELAPSSPNFALVTPANNFSISLWYKASTSDIDTNGSEVVTMYNQYIIRLGKVVSGGVTTGYRIEWDRKWPGSSGYVQCFSAFSLEAGTPPFLDGSWHNLTVLQTSTAPGIAIYVDNTLMPCTTLNLPSGSAATSDIAYSNPPGNFRIGRHPSDNKYDFQGNLDEVRIYDRVLRPAEIQALAQGVQLPSGP
jgi:hypothetical protein